MPAISRMTRCRVRRILSGALFVVAFLFPVVIDLLNLLGITTVLDAAAVAELQAGVLHAMFHILTPVIGLGLAALVLAAAVALGPYLRGETWAWWTLALAGVAVFATKIWGTLTLYAHGILSGLTVELELPVLLWLVAMALSWQDFLRQPKEAYTP